jgi:DNA-directed RNA polymerase specialized sigma subunit
MDIKKMLSEYPTYSDRIRELNEKINDALNHKIDCDTLKAQKLSGMPYGTGLSDPTFEAVQRIIDKWDSDIRKMAEEVNRLIDNKTAIDKGLNALTWKEYRLIELRYIIGLTWERVAAEANYGVQHCHRLHRQALEKMRKALM